MEYPKEWETVDEENNAGSERLKVPGGWIVRSYISGTYQAGAALHQIFISDPKHIWYLSTEE